MRKGLWVAAAVLVVGSTVAQAQDARVFTGEYQWKQGGDDTLIAEFAPDGEAAWKVTFRFDWSGKRNTWKGEATGALTDGSDFEGTARSKDGRREWRFRGTLEDGVMRGSHVETTGDREYETGTFELRR